MYTIAEETPNSSNPLATLHDKDIERIVNASDVLTNDSTLYHLLHYVKNQLDVFGAYRHLRGYMKLHPELPMPSILVGDGLMKYNNLLGSVRPVCIFGIREGRTISFRVYFLQRIVLDTEICTPSRESILSTQMLGDLSPARVMNGKDTDYHLPIIGGLPHSTFLKSGNTSAILHLYDLGKATHSGNVYEGKDAGHLNMMMPLAEVHTVQFVDVTDNPDYMQTYGALVSELIDTEWPIIDAAHTNTKSLTHVNRWVFDPATGCTHNNSVDKEFTIQDLT